MRARKHFGQHFLADGNVIRRIIAAIRPAADDHFVEIGPGRGAMTIPLLAAGARLDAIEIDRDLARDLPGLPAVAPHAGQLRVHCADALKFDFGALREGGRPLRLAGNLPYNISTPLLFHFLAQGSAFRDLHVMLQKEVGDRMVAVAGSRTYGRLTVALALRCAVEPLFSISPGSFRPAPQVDSVFLRLAPHATPMADAATLGVADRLVTQAFSMRRKRLSNGLRGLMSSAEIAATGLDPGTRPEQLPPADWLKLAREAIMVNTALARTTNPLPE